MKRLKRWKGFTLIEMMLVVAIISVLAAIAIPKFANMVIKSKEAALRGQLGGLRSAMSIYYADTEGIYPRYVSPGAAGLNVLTVGTKYLDRIPSNTVPTVPGHTPYSFMTATAGPLDSFANGGMSFWAATTGVQYTGTGPITINCTHTDTRGSMWSEW